MGEIVASMELENTLDRDNASDGFGDESTVRRATVEGVVDAGVVMLVLPEDVVGRLGLRTQRQVAVVYADERGAFSEGARGACPSQEKELRPVAGPVTIHIGNRPMITDCVVGPLEQAADRPYRAGKAGLGSGLPKSHAWAAPGVAGPSRAEDEMSRRPPGLANA